VLGALSDYPIPLNAGVFSLMDRKAVDSINSLGEKNRYLPGLRAWVGFRNTVVLYDRQDRAGGEGKLSFLSRIKYAMDAIASFSYKPLRLSFALFLFADIVAGLFAGMMLLAKTPTVIGALGVSASVFFVGGLLLLCLGIFGEYLGRVYDEVRKRPLSIINEVHRTNAMELPHIGVMQSKSNGKAKTGKSEAA
jgi:dolichol-phosphate mannosyltransferase